MLALAAAVVVGACASRPLVGGDASSPDQVDAIGNDSQPTDTGGRAGANGGGAGGGDAGGGGSAGAGGASGSGGGGAAGGGGSAGAGGGSSAGGASGSGGGPPTCPSGFGTPDGASKLAICDKATADSTVTLWPGELRYFIDVAWLGDRWGVLAADGPWDSGALVLATFSVEGKQLDELTLGKVCVRSAAIATAGDRWGIVWYDCDNFTFQLVDASLKPCSQVPLRSVPDWPEGRYLRMAWNGSLFGFISRKDSVVLYTVGIDGKSFKSFKMPTQSYVQQGAMKFAALPGAFAYPETGATTDMPGIVHVLDESTGKELRRFPSSTVGFLSSLTRDPTTDNVTGVGYSTTDMDVRLFDETSSSAEIGSPITWTDLVALGMKGGALTRVYAWGYPPEDLQVKVAPPKGAGTSFRLGKAAGKARKIRVEAASDSVGIFGMDTDVDTLMPGTAPEVRYMRVRCK